MVVVVFVLLLLPFGAVLPKAITMVAINKRTRPATKSCIVTFEVPMMYRTVCTGSTHVSIPIYINEWNCWLFDFRDRNTP